MSEVVFDALSSPLGPWLFVGTLWLAGAILWVRNRILLRRIRRLIAQQQERP